MIKRIITIIILTLCISTISVAQNEDLETIIDEIISNATESDSDEDIEGVQYTKEYLEFLSENKLNINSIDNNDLYVLPFITDKQADEIIKYRNRYNSIDNFGELKATSINKNLLNYFPHFMEISGNNQPKYSYKQMITKGKHYVSTSMKTVLEKQAGYIADSTGAKNFQGNNIALGIKYHYNFKDQLAWGFTCEKDAGESLAFGDYKYGFDFYSMFLKIRFNKLIDKLIIGDYKIKFGQGLMLGSGLTLGKYVASENYNRNDLPLREYSSYGETNFYRGAAVSIKTGNFLITTFASANLVDATCEDGIFHSLKTDGYHRTEKELANKDNLREIISGILADFTSGMFRISAAVNYYNYDKKYIPNEKFYNLNLSSTQEGIGTSISYKYTNRQIGFYGETAFDNNFNIATINVLDITPLDNLRFSIMQRKYHKNYLAFKSSAFSQNTRVNNEDGFYIGLSTQPSKWIAIDIWADIFKFPWATTYTRTTTSGHEALLQTNFRLNRQLNFQLKLKQKNRTQSDVENDFQRSEYLKTVFTYNSNSNFKFSTAAQWSRYKNMDSCYKGYLVYEDLTYKQSNSKYSFSVRYALFSAPYSARIYAYEADVNAFFSVPGYYYDGQRWYLMASFKPTKKIVLQLKLSQWKYFDREKISSGNSMIDGSHKTELNFYAKYVID